MNKKQQQIIDEVYETFVAAVETDRPDDYTRPIMTRDEFVKELKLNVEFSEKWGMKIEERELTWEERVQWVMKFTDVEWENLYIVEEIAKETTPTKLITIKYNNEKIESYE